MDDQIVLLDIEGVDPPSDAARDIIDPDKVRELAESIRSQGLLQPILVRPRNGRHEVVAGHRRYLAHRLIGEVKIKSIIKELSDDEVILIRGIENDQREDLNPIERGKVYRRLRDRFGWSDNAIAQRMGRHPSTIKKYLNLLELSEQIQSELSRGRIGLEVALLLGSIEDEQARRYYVENAAANGVTIDVARGWVEDYEKSRLGTFYSEGGGSPQGSGLMEEKPVFQTCDVCLGPVNAKEVVFIPVCKPCLRKVRSQGRG